MLLGNSSFNCLLWEKSCGAILTVVIQLLRRLKDLAKWKVKDARVMSWILGSVDPLIVLNLRPYKFAKAM
jgi:hypothetical protein